MNKRQYESIQLRLAEATARFEELKDIVFNIYHDQELENKTKKECETK